ncbi:hypothetical protein Dsin_024422 [Dipteronia sinensis]|uniref:DUF1985 domain-containing protein n=1 Tax=Dipteronia sinensis TaxID=43782 RepID=A0AAE0DW16_9ROSI|nr:hypothetical protein Dsin_024422 [Dipteronia sinensis]
MLRKLFWSLNLKKPSAQLRSEWSKTLETSLSLSKNEFGSVRNEQVKILAKSQPKLTEYSLRGRNIPGLNGAVTTAHISRVWKPGRVTGRSDRGSIRWRVGSSEPGRMLGRIAVGVGRRWQLDGGSWKSSLVASRMEVDVWKSSLIFNRRHGSDEAQRRDERRQRRSRERKDGDTTNAGSDEAGKRRTVSRQTMAMTKQGVAANHGSIGEARRLQLSSNRRARLTRNTQLRLCGLVMGIIIQIKEKLTEAQLALFRTTCFGKLLQMHELKFSGAAGIMDFYRQNTYDEESETLQGFAMQLAALVPQMERLIVSERAQARAMNSYNLWPVPEPFEHSYNPYPINEPYGNSHPCGPNPPVLGKEKRDGSGSFRSSMLNGEVRYNNKTLEAIFKAAFLDNDEDMVKLALLYFLEMVLFGKDQKVHISALHVELLENLETFNKYPWGRKCYETTLNSLQRDLRKMSQEYHTTSKKMISNKKRKRQDKKENDGIRQMRCMGFLMHFRFGRVRQFPLLELRLLINLTQVLKKLQPTPRERGEEYVKFLLSPEYELDPPKIGGEDEEDMLASL